MSEFDRDREVIAAATEGPWMANEKHGVDAVPLGEHIAVMDSAEDIYATPPADAAFIARARTRWEVALDEVGRLRAGLKDLRDCWIWDIVHGATDADEIRAEITALLDGAAKEATNE